ncbi:MAG TPA: adenylate/guanylate cyclase domain-containing protein [Candidatus Limnocylindria bacterium]|nr:adenylate/guanylate cyclase domain-containing protein [Candidatus Limnocylindria bacterium]
MTSTESNPMRCAACGTENRAGSRFCDNCGTPLESPCPSCGAPNRSDARFCASCGHAFADAPAALATAPEQEPSQRNAERRVVSVLFTDLVGFTTLAEDRDPEAVRDLLSRYFERATGIITVHGGTVEKFIGDAVMAVWGTPIAHEDDAERAVRAALELVDAVHALSPDLQARAGVLSGEAAVTLNAQNQGMVAGDLVNTAARLQGVAEAGTVLVGESTMRAAERAIVFEPIGDNSLKGKTSPVPAWRAVRVVAQRGGHGRADALEAPFVGREEELRQLKETLHAVGRERRTRLVSITGPGGIGKSRLVWELEKYVDGVAEDVYWHRGRSPSYGEGVTFWALGEMVRRRAQLTEDADEATTRDRIASTVLEYVNDASERERIGPALLALLGVEDAPAGGRDELFPAWQTFFERIAERGTTVLVFEDLQWADAGLLDFIDHLLDWSRGLPIMVVTLARPELFDRRPGWASNRRHLTALALEPLTDAAVRELLNGLVPGLPDDALAAIVGRAEGVPLYAVETVRGLLADGRIRRDGDVYEPVGDLSTITVPDSLRSLIASRLDALEPADRGLLQDAAVLGQVFTADALAATSGTELTDLEPRLRDFARRELLDLERDPSSPERGQYKFVQSLIREVAYGTLARRDRRSRHLAVARHYEGLGDDELAGALASHYLAAHDASEPGEEADAVAAQARIALSAAAARAANLGSHEQAVAYLEQALAVTTAPADRAPLLDRAARSGAAATMESAETYAREAIDAYRETGDAGAAARATARLGRVLMDGGHVGRARSILEAAVAEAEASGEEVALAQVLANLARAYMRAGNGASAVEAADRALVIAERLNLDDVVVEAWVNKGSGLNILGRRREAIVLQEAALELVQQVGDRSTEMRIRNNLASAMTDDDPRRAIELYTEGAELARSIGDRGMYNWLTGTGGATAFATGRDWDRHLAAMREALDGATLRTDRARLITLIGIYERTRAERLSEIVEDLEAIVGDSSEEDDQFLLNMSRAEVAMLTGDTGRAHRMGMEMVAQNPQNPEVPGLLAMQAAVLSRDPAFIRAAAEMTAELRLSGAWTSAQRVMGRAMLAAVDGRPQDAIADMREARAVLKRLGVSFEDATYVVLIATVLPDEPEVRRWAEEVRPLLVELRATPWLGFLDEALARGTGSPGTGAPAEASTPVES